MKERITRAFSRARYAAIGGAIGGAAGGLFSRNAASTGAATGALLGVVVAEKRASAGSWIEEITGGDDEDDSPVDSVVETVTSRKQSGTDTE
jgi:osmotically inducible lipoprotein OsmB